MEPLPTRDRGDDAHNAVGATQVTKKMPQQRLEVTDNGCKRNTSIVCTYGQGDAHMDKVSATCCMTYSAGPLPGVAEVGEGKGMGEWG